MHFAARRLAGDENARRGMHLQHRARPQRQVAGAEGAGVDISEKRGQGCCWHHFLQRLKVMLSMTLPHQPA